MITTLEDFLEGIRQRKAELGIVDALERTEAMRNKGARRTEEKRAMLARVDERARQAGITPLKAYY